MRKRVHYIKRHGNESSVSTYYYPGTGVLSNLRLRRWSSWTGRPIKYSCSCLTIQWALTVLQSGTYSLLETGHPSANHLAAALMRSSGKKNTFTVWCERWLSSL